MGAVLYTTKNEDGSPVEDGSWIDKVLPSRPGPNILTLLRMMQESKLTSTRLLATYMPAKWSPDLLVETYFKCANRIIKSLPTFSTEEQVQQHVRECLRQRVRDQTGLAIPGTVNRMGAMMVPFQSTGDAGLPDMLEALLASDAVEDEGSKLDDAKTKKADDNSLESVASLTASWIQRVRSMLFTHRYSRMPDIIIQGTRVVEFGPRKGVRNPQLYPRVSFICTESLGFIFDIFINTTKLDVFAYGSQQPHQVTVPPSLLAAPFMSALPVDEFTQYQRGLALSLLKIRDCVNKARQEDDRTKTLNQVK